MCRVKLYQNKVTEKKLFVIFDIYSDKQGLCGNSYECKAIRHYQCLTPDYKPQTTTIDNLKKNFNLIDAPTGVDARQLMYIKNS